MHIVQRKHVFNSIYRFWNIRSRISGEYWINVPCELLVFIEPWTYNNMNIVITSARLQRARVNSKSYVPRSLHQASVWLVVLAYIIFISRRLIIVNGSVPMTGMLYLSIWDIIRIDFIMRVCMCVLTFY